MSLFTWVLCGWGGGGRSSEELVRAPGREKLAFTHIHLLEQSTNTLTVSPSPFPHPPVCMSAAINLPDFRCARFPLSPLPWQVTLTGGSILGKLASRQWVSILPAQMFRGQTNKSNKKYHFCACDVISLQHLVWISGQFLFRSQIMFKGLHIFTICHRHTKYNPFIYISLDEQIFITGFLLVRVYMVENSTHGMCVRYKSPLPLTQWCLWQAGKGKALFGDTTQCCECPALLPFLPLCRPPGRRLIRDSSALYQPTHTPRVSVCVSVLSVCVTEGKSLWCRGANMRKIVMSSSGKQTLSWVLFPATSAIIWLPNCRTISSNLHKFH